MDLTGQALRVADLTTHELDAMFTLMCDYYAEVERTTFLADLEEKHWVLVLRDRAHQTICGFSTQLLVQAEINSQTVRALFSGDTIVRRECWTQNRLAHIWGNFVLKLMDQFPSCPLYWFLTTKGYRTYRFLPVFFREFYPRYDVPTPDWAHALIDVLGVSRSQTAYDPSRHLLQWGSDGYRLRRGVADITDARLRDPHVRFFHASNPRHAWGDELCCVAPLTRDNFTPAAWRVIGVDATLAQVP